jgi:hypothetical protein
VLCYATLQIRVPFGTIPMRITMCAFTFDHGTRFISKLRGSNQELIPTVLGAPPRVGYFELAPGSYRFPSLPASDKAIWRIEIEDCVVYHAPIPSMSGLVV